MQTQKIVDRLNALDIPSFSVAGVVQELGQQEFSFNQAIEQIEAITGTRPNVTDEHEAKLMFQYLVQDGLRLKKQGVESVDTNWMMDSSLLKAKTFIKKYPFVFATGEEVKLNADGDVKRKKGWKQDRAIELWKANPNLGRKEMIKLFEKELDMSTAGATTYFHNMKTKMQETN